jgi:calcium uniporter protein, mitochondrial
LLSLFGIGAILMRSAGCAINDLWDYNIDKHVERTKTTRPLVTGEITKQQAIMFTIGCIVSSVVVVINNIPNSYECFLWSIPALGLVILYPTTKRYFLYPQLVLGLTFNWGCFMGYVTKYGTTMQQALLYDTVFYSTILPLYCGSVCWTIVYDTLYGHQDKNDDKKLGLHSTAINFGSSDQQQRAILYTLTGLTALSWSYIGIHEVMTPITMIDLVPAEVDLSPASLSLALPDDTSNPSTAVATIPNIEATATAAAAVSSTTTDTSIMPVFNSPYYYLLGITGATTHMIWQISTAQFNNPSNLAQRFQSNNTVGAIILTSILAGKYL